jgi:hypothetical protein
MGMMSTRALKIAAVFVAAAWLTALPARAQVSGAVVSLGADRVTVRAEGVPVGELLQQLAALAPLERLDLDPSYRSTPVSLVVENVSPLAAIAVVLKASGLDYLMSDTQVVAGRGKLALDAPGRSRDRETQNLDGPGRERVAVDAPVRTDDRSDAERRAAVVAEAAPVPAAVAGEAMVAPGSIAADDFGAMLGAVDVPYVVKEDSVTITQPGFVPYRMRPDVRRQREMADVAAIP